jgi:hypothetical protein
MKITMRWFAAAVLTLAMGGTARAIDAGMGVGLKEDLAGTKVPQGKAPDIGAYEFNAK